uniref:Uncharacterized protein n=1 Tax=Cacopsylla melanoneura TaxID=428564 RepID=A0A8D8VIY5_9HEMI
MKTGTKNSESQESGCDANLSIVCKVNPVNAHRPNNPCIVTNPYTTSLITTTMKLVKAVKEPLPNSRYTMPMTMRPWDPNKSSSQVCHRRANTSILIVTHQPMNPWNVATETWQRWTKVVNRTERIISCHAAQSIRTNIRLISTRINGIWMTDSVNTRTVDMIH